MNNGTRLNFKETEFLHYARAHGSFTYDGSRDSYKPFIKRASEAQKNRDVLTIILSFTGDFSGERDRNSALHTLQTAGVSVLNSGHTINGFIYYYIIADASAINWFAYSE